SSFEVAVAGADSIFAGRDLIVVHRETGGTAGLTQLEARRSQYIQDPFLPDLLLHDMTSGHDPRRNMIGLLTIFYDRGKGAEILDAPIGTAADKYIVHFFTQHGIVLMEAHIVQGFLIGGLAST